MLVVKDSKAMKRVTFPTTRVARLTIWVVEDSISFKLALLIELPFISCSIAEFHLPIAFIIENLVFTINDFTFARNGLATDHVCL